MQNSLNFLPRLQMRGLAQAAYRFAMTHGKFTSINTVGGVRYTSEVDCDLDSVFVRFETDEGEPKVSVHAIQKGW